jgi:phage-related protein
MERLIADANEYRASIGETADLSIESFADVVLAIQSVQEAQNIAGTTNKEAMRTIEGSANATKAAWQNVITAIGRGEGLSEALDGLITSVFGEDEETGLLNQIIPRIQTVMESIGDFISKASPYITEKIPQLIKAVLPSLVSGGMELLSAISQGFMDALPELLWTIGDIVETLLEAFVESTANNGSMIMEVIDRIIGVFEENYMQFIDMGMEILTNIIQGMIDNIPIIIYNISEIIKHIGETLMSICPYS